MTKEELKAKNENLFERNTILLNENRLLGERCNQLLKDKGDLTDQIADIKANCDLAIEGRDVKIRGLEEKNTELEKESNRLFLEGAKRVEELEKENAELRNNGFTVSAMTEQQLKAALKKGEQLEKENAELKDKVSFLEDNLRVARKDRENLQLDVAKGLKEFVKDYPATSLRYLANEKYIDQLTKAKELLKGWLGDFYNPKAFHKQIAELVEQSEHFIKEIEK